jgi:hypothetical protein
VIEPRKTLWLREVLRANAFGEPGGPVTRVAAAVVFRNPCAGRYETDLTEISDIGAFLGEEVSADLAAMLQNPAVSYGKAAIVGVAGETEHGAALLHPSLGKPMRAAIGGGKVVIPSNVKLGPPGTPIDVPLAHKDDPWSRDHFDTWTITVPEAPGPGEIVLVVAFADGGRVGARC